MSMDSAASDAVVDAIVAEFRLWLERERGLSAATVCCYGKQARKFLSWLPDPADSAVQQLDSTQVTSFMVAYCRDRKASSAKATVTAVRAFLRYLHATGWVRVSLVGAVPAVAGWRLASLPKGLDAAVVTRLLDTCDRDTFVGRRDRAILLLLARLGLRGAEVADVRVGDVDWRAGEITIRGKGNRLDRLPLPIDVGEAMVAYLTAGRPVCDTRTVFCTARKPYRRLSASAIRAIMGRACRGAGLTRIGAHRLRHTLATEMLRAGSSFPEVGQGLRHRNNLATSIYAKVDDNVLRMLARPWPTGDRS
ncbi:tyrosine-type recombinase/integrase [Rhodococcus opacus]|uniref:tyrosine-type recombinase/integrase n=1 Tax=Rhodococcus opacus TaxID=37919 RepID=UPI002948CF1A|nr:tyrosine-type recombinase/integrase [Rhodococcus opacus]MDV6247184.1 tyrosine-type recombinase/integrase [Rhodococcus opacus]